jgi:pyruvate/2-oxoglutarate dehydrogenase complex dihydrolipoamide acyltransferase (E2) component
MSAEAFTSGIFAAVVTREGESAPVGAPVALIAKKEADVRPFIHYIYAASFPSPSASTSSLIFSPSSLPLPSPDASLLSVLPHRWPPCRPTPRCFARVGVPPLLPLPLPRLLPLWPLPPLPPPPPSLTTAASSPPDTPRRCGIRIENCIYFGRVDRPVSRRSPVEKGRGRRS